MLFNTQFSKKIKFPDILFDPYYSNAFWCYYFIIMHFSDTNITSIFLFFVAETSSDLVTSSDLYLVILKVFDITKFVMHLLTLKLLVNAFGNTETIPLFGITKLVMHLVTMKLFRI